MGEWSSGFGGSGATVIRCRDIAAMTAFYRDLLGLVEVEGDLAESAVALAAPWERRGGAAVVVLYPTEEGEDGPAEDAFDEVPPAHLVLVMDTDAWEEARRWLVRHGVDAAESERPALGWKSLRLRDPEGNTVELAVATRQRTPDPP